MNKLIQINTLGHTREEVKLPDTNNPISLYHWQDEFYKGAPSHVDYLVVDEDNEMIFETEEEFNDRKTPGGIKFLRTEKDYKGK